MGNPRWRGLWIVVTATTGCGGDLLGAPSDASSDEPLVTAADASSPTRDAGSGETSPPPVQDGAGVDAVGPTCGSESWATVFGSFLDAGAPLDQVWEFVRLPDFLDFVRNQAVIDNAVDWQGNLLCPTHQVETCTYNPTLPRTSPQDVNHSNALNEFIDGRPYVWAYYPPVNKWFLVDATRNPEGYQLLVDFNAGCSPNCACDAG